VRLALFILLLVGCFKIKAATVSDTLFIKGDSLVTVGNVSIPYLTFNTTATFGQSNPVLSLVAGDSLDLTIINMDTAAHIFSIDGMVTSSLMLADDTVHVGALFPAEGVYQYHGIVDFPRYSHCGLGGMIVVKNHSHPSFYWNLKTHQTGLNDLALAGTAIDWTTYTPDYYTINGNSYPDINGDADARITGNTGDTIYLYITNTGQSVHSLHFHGYHGEIVFSSKTNLQLGWIKDTFPIYNRESLIIRIVPDKPEEYPIHDHNLVAVSGNGLYPNGMLTTILINP